MILGIIPARNGSKGIKYKNTFDLCGYPLYYYTFNSAIHSKLDDVIISTDIESILLSYPEFSFERPKKLCKDNSKSIDLLKYIIKEFPKFEYICLLQPTSPLRNNDHINEALKLLGVKKSLYSGYKLPIKNKNKTFDKHEDKYHFQRNGAIFITHRDLIEQNKIWDDDVVEYEMPLSKSIDIDTLDDMFIVESIIKNGGLNKC